MRIISPRIPEHFVEYTLSFKWRNDSGGGMSFPCDQHGNIDLLKMKPAAIDNYNKCISGEHDVIANGVQKYEWTYVHPAIGECVCGAEVVLEGFTNPCERCDRDYNMSGQGLAPREQWGEETGETLSDILSIK